MYAARFVVCGFWMCVASGIVHAQGTQISLGDIAADPGTPVEITSETLSIDRATGLAVFSGDVLVVQGELKLTAKTVEVTYTESTDTVPGGVREVVATGDVLLVNGPDAAESEKAVFDPIQNTVVMTGDVLLTQGPAVVSGEKLVVDLQSGSGTMEGRVRTVLQTESTE